MEKSIYSKEYALFLKVLRNSRNQAGLTQIALAERLGATQTFVSKCERGERRLDFVEVNEWCNALGIDTQELLQKFNNGRFLPENRKL
jgi:transcriptional regulator with XRE-family HTH domain